MLGILKIGLREGNIWPESQKAYQKYTTEKVFFFEGLMPRKNTRAETIYVRVQCAAARKILQSINHIFISGFSDPGGAAVEHIFRVRLHRGPASRREPELHGTRNCNTELGARRGQTVAIELLVL